MLSYEPARVLVLSEDADVRQGMLALVQDEGGNARASVSCAEAVAACRQDPPDVLFVAGVDSVDEIMRLLSDLDRLLGERKPRVALVFGLRSAGARFLPGVSYSLFAPASGARMREFVRECVRPRDRDLRHSAVTAIRVESVPAADESKKEAG